MKKIWVLCFLLLCLTILPASAAETDTGSQTLNEKIATILQEDKGSEAKTNLPRVMIMYPKIPVKIIPTQAQRDQRL